MADYIIDGTVLTGIADAIRTKTGRTETITPEDMAEAIGSIECGGATVEDDLIENAPTTYINERVTKLANNAFAGNKFLLSVSFPNVVTVGESAFSSCSELTTVDLPNATELGNSALYSSKKVTKVNAPKLKTIGSNAFRYAPLSESVKMIFPELTSLSGYAFQGCTGMEYIDINVAPAIGSYTFYGCTSLNTIVIRKTDKVVTLANTTNTLTNTPIANGTGFVYVPDDLVESYKAATNWSTYANQIKPLSELEVET